MDGGAAATLAAERVAQVADRSQARLDLLSSSYDPLPGALPRAARGGVRSTSGL